MKKIVLCILLLAYSCFITVLPLAGKTLASGCAQLSAKTITPLTTTVNQESPIDNANDEDTDKNQNMQVVEKDDCNCQEPAFGEEFLKLAINTSVSFSDHAENKIISATWEIFIPPPEI